jgi:hypothetical protein
VGLTIEDGAWMCGTVENHTAKSGCATFSATCKASLRHAQNRLTSFHTRAKESAPSTVDLLHFCVIGENMKKSLLLSFFLT